MSGASHKNQKRRFNREEQFVRGALNEWDLIPGSPEDEYDCLVHHILSALHAGANQEDLEMLIEEEMSNHFGLSATKSTETDLAVARTILEWWTRERSA